MQGRTTSDEQREGRYLSRQRRISLVLGFICVCLYIVSCSSSTDDMKSNSKTNTPGFAAPAGDEANSSETNKIKTLTNSLQNSEELAVFRHENEYHSQLSCLICHRRNDNSARIKMPGREGHTPCIGCHTQQFEDKNNPICTICHTDTENGNVKRFPPLRNFNARFDHAKHMRKTNCTTCHKSSRGGVAQSIPAGAMAHNTCFQCHSANANHNLSSCSVCHQPGRRPAGPSQSANIFAVFSHAKHKQSCTSCHNIKAGAGRGRQVTSIRASMHFAPKNTLSCATCHNNKRAFGGDDFKDCKRCHKGKDFKF